MKKTQSLAVQTRRDPTLHKDFLRPDAAQIISSTSIIADNGIDNGSLSRQCAGGQLPDPRDDIIAAANLSTCAYPIDIFDNDYSSTLPSIGLTQCGSRFSTGGGTWGIYNLTSYTVDSAGCALYYPNSHETPELAGSNGIIPYSCRLSPYQPQGLTFPNGNPAMNAVWSQYSVVGYGNGPAAFGVGLGDSVYTRKPTTNHPIYYQVNRHYWALVAPPNAAVVVMTFFPAIFSSTADLSDVEASYVVRVRYGATVNDGSTASSTELSQGVVDNWTNPYGGFPEYNNGGSVVRTGIAPVTTDPVFQKVYPEGAVRAVMPCSPNQSMLVSLELLNSTPPATPVNYRILRSTFMKTAAGEAGLSLPDGWFQFGDEQVATVLLGDFGSGQLVATSLINDGTGQYAPSAGAAKVRYYRDVWFDGIHVNLTTDYTVVNGYVIPVSPLDQSVEVRATWMVN